MGRVALLSGQPQEGVAIEARSDSKGYYEETTSDIDGNYRLRGLHPGATYVIKVSKRNGSGKNNIERASPESVSLQVLFLISISLHSHHPYNFNNIMTFHLLI